jgi:hypothetical protein
MPEVKDLDHLAILVKVYGARFGLPSQIAAALR